MHASGPQALGEGGVALQEGQAQLAGESEPAGGALDAEAGLVRGAGVGQRARGGAQQA